MNARIVEFDGYGQPRVDGIVTGSVLILVQEKMVSIVSVELRPPEDYGPFLHHALNEEELRPAATELVRSLHPTCLDSSRHWTIECPARLAAQARFTGSMVVVGTIYDTEFLPGRPMVAFVVKDDHDRTSFIVPADAAIERAVREAATGRYRVTIHAEVVAVGHQVITSIDSA